MSMDSDFVAFAQDEASLRTLKEWADRQGYPSASVHSGGAELFASMLDNEKAPKLIFVDFDNLDDPMQMAARIVSLCKPKCKIIGIGIENDVSLYRSMITAGIQDYLVKPITIDGLTQAMIAATQEAGQKVKRETKNIIFIGVRGGVGTSTLATNIAWIYAHEKKIKTVLLDLDLQYGTTALALDLEPGHGLCDLVNSPQRVDALMISGATIMESENLSVLSAEESIEDPLAIDPYAVTTLVKELRINNQAILIDMPRQLIATQKRILSSAHEIVLITEMSLVGIRDTLRVRNMLKALGSLARITQVVSRIENKMGAIDEATFIKGTNAKVHFMIPNDAKTLATASNTGKTLSGVAPNAPITVVLHELATHLLGENDSEKANKDHSFSLFGFLGQDKKDAKK